MRRVWWGSQAWVKGGGGHPVPDDIIKLEKMLSNMPLVHLSPLLQGQQTWLRSLFDLTLTHTHTLSHTKEE